MSNNLTNNQLMIRNYIENILAERFPNIDLNETGAFYELFVGTHLSLLEPLLLYMDRIALMQSIDNAESLTESEMDIVASRYFVSRTTGERASGQVVLIFNDLNPSISSLNIGAGLRATSAEGYQFVSVDSLVIPNAQLYQFFTSRGRYEIPITFQALFSGSVYNVAAGQITSLDQPIANLSGVFNPNPFSGGTDTESNTELLERIKTTFRSPNLGVTRGYIATVENNFPNVEDIYVAGYKDPLMIRDRVKIINSSGAMQEVSWGSKIDIYIRGSELTTEVVTLKALNYSSSKSNVSLSAAGNGPIYDVVSVTKLQGNIATPVTFTLLSETDPHKTGSVNENVVLVFSKTSVPLDTEVTVTYRQNSLISNIQNFFTLEENRPPTADVLVRQAKRKFINGTIIAKPIGREYLLPSDIAFAKQSIFDYVSNLRMNGEVQFSDLCEAVVSDNNTGNPSPIDLIQYPSQFIVFEKENLLVYECLSDDQKKFIDGIISDLTDYRLTLLKSDFLWTLHLLSYQYGLTNDIFISNLSFKSSRKKYANSNIVYDLSPSITTSQTNEYFEVSNINIFNYIKNAGTQTLEGSWTSDIQSLITIAQQTGTNKTIDDLTKFCLAIVFVCARPWKTDITNTYNTGNAAWMAFKEDAFN